MINDSRPVSPGTRRRVERAILKLRFRPKRAGRAPARRTKAQSGGAASEWPAGLRMSPAGQRARDWTNGRPGTAAGEMALALLRLVRAAQPVSRADIARRFGVHRSTVTDLVRPLLAEGLLRETEMPTAAGEARMGRPGTGLEFTDEIYSRPLSTRRATRKSRSD
ncbi:MAG: hypothetical protein DMF66_07030 [Acidobacteria bacterium]|nr:MAG: hypothetical protein DMF66_07030 [Acidobacteriota bacterium]